MLPKSGPFLVTIFFLWFDTTVIITTLTTNFFSGDGCCNANYQDSSQGRAELILGTQKRKVGM